MNFPQFMNTLRVALFNHFVLFGNRYKYGIMPLLSICLSQHKTHCFSVGWILRSFLLEEFVIDDLCFVRQGLVAKDASYWKT